MMPAPSDATSFKWATVTQQFPLRIQLDGDTAPLALEPDSLVDPLLTPVGTRVRVELTGRKVIVHGSNNGSNNSLEAHSVLTTNTAELWWYHEKQPTTLADMYPPFVAHRTSLGLVIIEGLMYNRVALPAGYVMTTLPPAFRPLQRKRFVLNDAGTSAWGIVIEPDGRVILNTAMSAGLLISFDGVCYNNDPNLPRYDLRPLLKNGWVTLAGEGIPQVALDSAGRLFYEGCVGANGSTVPTSSNFLNLPAGYFNTQRTQLTVVNEFNSGTGLKLMGRLDYPASPTPANGLMSFGVPTITATTKRSMDAIGFADSLNNTFLALNFGSGSNYGSGWQECGYWHAPDGAVHLRGLSNLAAPTQNIAQLMAALGPRYRKLFISENADNVGRLDISAVNAQMQNVTGIAGFYSLNHVTYWPNPIAAR